ncbi:MAG: Smr/MutS family protein [Burkholderiales bacterium]
MKKAEIVEEGTLFRDAMRGVTPLPSSSRYNHLRRPPTPIPRQTLLDELNALHDSLRGSPYASDYNDDGSYVRSGASRSLLGKLRSRRWLIQGELDLHGLYSNEAKVELVGFLRNCRKLNRRFVRIVHGKGLGSKNQEPVLKHKVRSWLIQRDEVLAFCEAHPVDGGSGATLVLLASSR